MVDARRLFDALVGAASQRLSGTQASQRGQGFIDQALEAFGPPVRQGGAVAGQVLGQATEGLRDMAQRADQATGHLGARVNEAAGQVAGQVREQVTATPQAGQFIDQAKAFLGRNPGLAEAALTGVAGLLLSNRRSRGLVGSVAGLGGLALVSGLAYKAFQNVQAGRPLLDAGQGGPSPQGGTGGASPVPQVGSSVPTASLPEPAAFDPATATDDDLIRYVRAMVAAATADGHMDNTERARIVEGLAQAGIDAESTRWLERELASPADVEELSAGINTPEAAAKVYAAARIAIEPDTIQEREFLRQLARALDVRDDVVRHIDDAAAGLKAPS